MTTSVSQLKVRSDNRSGLFRLSLGVLCLAAGFACLLALTAQSVGQIFINLKSVCQSVAGVCAVSLPVPLFLSGILLCVSSRRRVSIRGYAISMSIYLCVMTVFTLITKMPPSNGFLMDYTAEALGRNNPTWAAYIGYAYQKAGFSSGLGAGALGMILAYPLYSVFRVIGSIVFLSVSIASLVIWMFRINLTHMFQSISIRPANGTVKKSAKSELNDRKPFYQHNRPGNAPGYIDEETLEVVRQPDGQLTEESVPYLVPDDYREHNKPGFVPVDAGTLYEQHFSTTHDAQYTEPKADIQVPRLSKKQQPASVNPPLESILITNTDGNEIQSASNGIRNRRRTERRNAAPTNETDDYENRNTPDAEAGHISGINSISAQNITTKTAKTMEIAGKQSANFANGISVDSIREGALGQRRSILGTVETVFPDTPSRKQTITAEPVAMKSVGENAPAAEIVYTPAKKPTSDATSNRQPVPVHTDPAVVLTGERISISPKTGRTIDTGIQAVPLKVEQLEIPYYEKPLVRLLNEPPEQQNQDTTQEDNAAAERLEHTLASFNIEAQVKSITHGPAITRFALRLAEGINVRRVTALMDNIAMEMKTMGVRPEVPIPGTSLVGIEVRNKKVSLVTLREVLDSPEMNTAKSPMAVALGKDIMGTPVLCNLSDMPHLLIAGATGSGKSVCINSIITSILYRATPQQVRMIMIDPKMVELQPYNGIPHLLLPVVSNLKKAAGALDWVVQEMNDRYQKLQTIGARSITNYNQLIGPGEKQMPYIVLIIDELSDLMTVCKKSVEESIMRLASLARAAGICLVLATQRPSVDVITGVIKANIPSRIAFAVSSQVDSRTIIDGGGAEKLAGSGDMLYAPRTELKPKRVQGCYISDNEVAAVTQYVKSRNKVDYDLTIIDHVEKNEEQPDQTADDDQSESAKDEFWEEAIEMAIESGQMSISMLQRRLRIGYARAGRLIDQMAKYGIISSSEGSKSRKTLITREDYKKKLGEGFIP